jgi:hypothetical protein
MMPRLSHANTLGSFTRSAPLIVDDDGHESEEQASLDLSRCTYLSIDTSDASFGWQLDLGNNPQPFLMLDLAGIIFRPITDGGEGTAQPDEFVHPDLITSTFEQIESIPELLVELGTLWLPNGFLSYYLQNYRVRPQDVIRLREDVLTHAVRFARSKISEREFVNLLHLPPSDNPNASPPPQVAPVRLSGQETRAFELWSRDLLHN